MSYKTKPTSRLCCERYQKHLSMNSTKCNRKSCTIAARPEPQSSNKNKSCSTGTLNTAKLAKPKKTTKSDLIYIGKDQFLKYGFQTKNNYCKSCGDSVPKSQEITPRNTFFIRPNCTKNCDAVEQYYKNENYRRSTASMQGADCSKKVSFLNTISEQSDDNSDISTSESQTDDSDSEIKFLESDIKDLKKFRQDNYFECHSTASKLKNKPSVIDLINHKCMYRFYLNERLFPVPISTDYNKIIRCTECLLPLNESDSKLNNLNGTIQAKVKLNGQLQDMMLMLPVKKSTIIKERRRELQERKEDDNLYFGIIKLSMDGDSIFNRNLPSNSFALKYEKGYQEYTVNDRYQYDSVNKDDVIII